MARWTYFIQSGVDGPIKIGFTSKEDPQERLRDLQTGNPEQLHLIAIIAGNVERELHEQFKNDRISGEWFHPSPELLTFINGLNRTHSGAINSPWGWGVVTTPWWDLNDPVHGFRRIVCFSVIGLIVVVLVNSLKGE